MNLELHPTFDRLLKRIDFEQKLSQQAKAIWLTGLSGSGKTTIAQGLQKKLWDAGFFAQVLDGDNIRTGISNNLDFSEKDRQENIRRIAELTKLFVHTGIITINCFISPTRAIRSQAKEIIGREDFLEIYIKASLDQCEKRDVKGLYKKARKGEIKNFTGIDSMYEAPNNPFLTIDTDQLNVENSINKLFNSILPQINL